ncbi:hypothetical protein N7494_005318 [Penicillium frequentans]|uniref:Uncharacterized protein n=1 Tax=Penicillium frequentans TaxID=3151616 RepID=A0AAD6GGX2_9EURO|nr:hypothetical protein N7494_005318 [Penicillium glabrum]
MNGGVTEPLAVRIAKHSPNTTVHWVRHALFAASEKCPVHPSATFLKRQPESATNLNTTYLAISGWMNYDCTAEENCNLQSQPVQLDQALLTRIVQQDALIFLSLESYAKRAHISSAQAPLS